MTTKQASDVGSTARTTRPKSRYQQFVEAATPSSTIKQDDVPLMVAMKHVRESIRDFSTLEPLLQTIILESVGEYLCTSSSLYFKVLAHDKMKGDPTFIPHSVRYKAELSAPAAIRGSQGFKAASAKADEILHDASIKMKGVLIDVAKLAINELREQLLKSVALHLLGLSGGLSIHLGTECYAKHRIVADLMAGHGLEVAKNILPGWTTKELIVAAYCKKHQLTALPPISIVPPPVANPYPPTVQAAGVRRDRTNFESGLLSQASDGLGATDMSIDAGTGDDGTPQEPIAAIQPTRIDDDMGWLSPHRVSFLVELNTWIRIIYGESWTKYLEEEEKIQKRKQLRKLRDEATKSALAEETQAILDRDGTMDRQSLDALITKRAQEELRRALAKHKTGDKTPSKGSDAKNKTRGQDGAAGQKKSVPPKNPTKKAKRSNGAKGGAAGGKGNDSSNASKGNGGGRSSNASTKKGKKKSNGKGASNKK